MKIWLTVSLATNHGFGQLFIAPKGIDQNGNKINGQHPQRRLQALNKFMCKWTNDYLNGPKSDRVCSRITQMMENFNDSFNRQSCAFFDPQVKFGGPNPNPDLKGMRLAKNPNAKSRYVSRSIRNRRTTIDPADLD